MRKLKDKDLEKYGSRTSAMSAMDKPVSTPKSDLDTDVAKIASKTKQGMSDSGSFGSAFKAARSSGDKTFTWRGTSYTTDLASDKPKRSAPAPTRSTSARATPAAAPARATPAAAPKYSADDFKRPKTPPKYSADDFKGPRIGRASALDTAKVTGFPRYSSSTAAPKVSKPTVSDVTATDFTGAKRNLSPEQKRKLQEAIARSGTRSSFAKGGSIDGCAVRGKTRAKRSR